MTPTRPGADGMISWLPSMHNRLKTRQFKKGERAKGQTMRRLPRRAPRRDDMSCSARDQNQRTLILLLVGSAVALLGTLGVIA